MTDYVKVFQGGLSGPSSLLDASGEGSKFYFVGVLGGAAV